VVSNRLKPLEGV